MHVSFFRKLRVPAVVLLFGTAVIHLFGASNHVILITIDGCAAYYLSDPKAPLNVLRKLSSEGATAEGMRVSNPAITWPNHTTLVTGVHPEKHSVFFNGVLQRPGPGRAVLVDGKRDKAELVAVPTLYDLLHQAGCRTADVNWPCTRGAATLDDSFPDVPESLSCMTPRLREDLISEGILSGTNAAAFQAQSAAVKDQIWTAAAARLIRERKPNFLLFHMLICDSTQHKYGPQSPAAYTALALADAQLGEVLRAVDAAGIRDRTTILVTADHGFDSALKVVQPNVTFRKAGLLQVAAAPGILRARAQAVSEGGTAMVYLTDPATREEDKASVLALLRNHEGIAEVLLPERFPALHFPDPTLQRQMADMILVAQPGYGFSNEAQGDDAISEVTLALGNQGYHGFLSTNPKMNAVFVAWGHGIKSGAKIGMINNIDVAPTIAFLLGETLPNADGRVLDEILTGGAR